jgi:uncharacterized protein
MRQNILIALCVAALSATWAAGTAAQERMTGYGPAYWGYELAPGVTATTVRWFSDGVGVHAKIFYPAGFDTSRSYPAVVVAHGTAGTSHGLEKYGARFAERGLVAMVIDYRGWGYSDGYATLVEPLPWPEGVEYQDEVRHLTTTAEVKVTRTRLLVPHQIEDYRNAISYIQGEPGVDPERIGIWGSSLAGGNVVAVAGQDARVRAVVAHVPAIGGRNVAAGPLPYGDAALEDAIQRARTGQGAEIRTGFSMPRMTDLESRYRNAEVRPFHYLEFLHDRAVFFLMAEDEELFSNRDNGWAAYEVLQGPKKAYEIPGATHFSAYTGEFFEIGSNLSADWFLEHLGGVR